MVAQPWSSALADTASMTPYSYRQDPDVPAFPDDRPVFVFDGVCVLCSGGAAWLMRHDKKRIFRLAPAQSPLGAALYAHYGIEMDATYLLVSGGLPYTKSSGYLHMCKVVGGWWKFFLVFGLVPRAVRDWGYDIIARNRYRWFGKVEYCELITDDLKPMLLDTGTGEAGAHRSAGGTSFAPAENTAISARS
jgi:predicted DCC family thiol-disulfide oxidoreductase YuxK